MKTLKKIQLKDAAVLSNYQLKQIHGGSGGGSGSPKVDACKGKSDGNSCSWQYDGKTYSGQCCYNNWAYVYACTDFTRCP